MVRVLKGAAWTLCSLMLAALIAGGLSFVIPCGNGEILMDHGDILRLSIPGIGAGISFLFLLVLAATAHRYAAKKDGSAITESWTDAFGFSLPAALCVWKIFEDVSEYGEGVPAGKGFPGLPWIMEEGVFRPCRIEAAAAGLLFLVLLVWLMARKEKNSPRGEIPGISAAAWAAVRMVTERFRLQPLTADGTLKIVPLAACAVVLLVAAFWTVQGRRNQAGRTMVLISWVLTAAGLAAVLLFEFGILSVGRVRGDIAVTAGAAAIAFVAVMNLRPAARA